MEQSTPKIIPSGMQKVWPKLDEFEDFPGWMKCWLRVLWDPWKMMCDRGDMGLSFRDKIEDSCPG